ncbi:MAG: nuclear transport factor 2 family protein [Actinobacteria bacterium]|nr:nuclear transport factor 2 family protein [Actinomycetota bacterium]
MSAVDETDVRAVCEAFGRAMQEMDFGAIEALWDRDNEHFVYQPEEFERPCRGWDEFRSYLDYIPDVVTSVRWDDVESDVAVLGDAAIVYAQVRLSLQFKGVDDPFEGDVRFSYGLRRTAAGWRLFHCHESRQLVLEEPADG